MDICLFIVLLGCVSGVKFNTSVDRANSRLEYIRNSWPLARNNQASSPLSSFMANPPTSIVELEKAMPHIEWTHWHTRQLDSYYRSLRSVYNVLITRMRPMSDIVEVDSLVVGGIRALEGVRSGTTFGEVSDASLTKFLDAILEEFVGELNKVARAKIHDIYSDSSSDSDSSSSDGEELASLGSIGIAILDTLF